MQDEFHVLDSSTGQHTTRVKIYIHPNLQYMPLYKQQLAFVSGLHVGLNFWG
jgi:hypothetical protein